MFKILIIILVYINIYAEIVNFKEERYIDAIDNSFYKKGTIKFHKGTIEVSYKSETKVLIYSRNKLIVKDKSQINEIDLEKNLHMKIFFNLLKYIYFNNKEELKVFFSIKQKDNTIYLKPKNLISNYISDISYKKTHKLNFLEILLNNNDRIYIEEID